MTISRFIPVKAFHPGVTLEEKLKEMKISVKEFALLTSKSEKSIFAIIKGEDSVTLELAAIFETVTGIPAHFWLNKQRHYDETLTKVRREGVRASYVPRLTSTGSGSNVIH